MGCVVKAVPLRLYGDGAEVLGVLALQNDDIALIYPTSKEPNTLIYTPWCLSSATCPIRKIPASCVLIADEAPLRSQQRDKRNHCLGFVSAALSSRTTAVTRRFWNGLRGVSKP